MNRKVTYIRTIDGRSEETRHLRTLFIHFFSLQTDGMYPSLSIIDCRSYKTRKATIIPDETLGRTGNCNSAICASPFPIYP